MGAWPGYLVLLPYRVGLELGKTTGYSTKDLKILKFIAENKRFDDVRGKEVWQGMEEGKVVKGRSWQSMKERFRKVISARIKSYGLSNETVKGFGRREEEGEENG